MKPLVKICGLTRPADARLAVDLGADLIGLNFFPASPRHVELPRAREIAAAVAGRALVVGVFVDPTRRQIDEAIAEVGLDLVQLHGDEPDELGRALGRRLLRALRGGEAPPGRLAAFPAAWGFLVDGGDRLRYGGTGEPWAWRPLPRLPVRQRMLVAGGLGPGNARAALVATGADGIDVASGVESSPGIKDGRALARLFEEIGHGEMEERT